MGNNKTLDLDTFGDIMNEFIEENHIWMIVDMPEGTQEVKIKDNAGAGPAVQFYILLQALATTYRGFRDILDEKMEESFINQTLEMVKEALLEERDERFNQ